MNPTTKPTIDIKAHPFNWDAGRRRFSCYVSELPQWAQDDIYGSRPVRLLNPETGRVAVFNIVAVDRDAEGEVCGWRYTGWGADDTKVDLLIIND